MDVSSKNLPDIKETINEYYKLKYKYENQITTNKKKIINNALLSNKEKRSEYHKLKPKCINCKRPGGTIFSTTFVPETDKGDAYRELKAQCGIIADPCNLDIKIRLAKIELIPEILKLMENDIKKYKNDIIDNKNKLLFGFSNAESAVEEFENIKEYISTYTSLYEEFLERYNKIIDNDDKKRELDETITNSYIEIQKIKDCILKMNETNNLQYANDAVIIYDTILQPLLKKIRELKYNETFVWHNEYTNTCNLIQNTYSISSLSYSSENDKVLSYNVGYSAIPNKQNKQVNKPLIIESSETSETIEPSMTSDSVETIESNEIPEPIYGDGIDGIRWNVPEYDKLWSNLPTKFRTVLASDPDWMKEFVSNCVKSRASGKPCTFIAPKNIKIPPEPTPDGKQDFGVNIYNVVFNKLPEQLQKTYLSYYLEKNGEKDYNMLLNAMNDLVIKEVEFNKGYF
jgi:hypothetical protein